MKTLYFVLLFCPLTLLSQGKQEKNEAPKDTTVAKVKFVEFLTEKQKAVQANAEAIIRDLEGMKRGISILKQDSVRVPVTIFKQE